MVAGTSGSLTRKGSTKITNPTILTAGIDTSKSKLDIAIHGRSDGFTVANDAAGWKRLTGQLVKAGVHRVGIEATGGYERGVSRHLQAAGILVVTLQPLQVKAFAKLHLKRAKSDRIDAVLRLLQSGCGWRGVGTEL